MQLAGKTALVTGAGSGIGEAIARRYAKEGAKVVVTGVHAENTMAVADAIVSDGGEAIGIQLDVSDSAAVASAIAETERRFGALDILVANAGLAGSSAYVGTLTTISDEAWNRIIAVNLSGVFYCAREAARVMMPRRSGCIITLGSVNSFVPEGDVPAYAASKGGVLLLTKSLARDLGPHGIRVNGIAPGGTDTPRMLKTLADLNVPHDELVSRIPIGRRAATSEMAGVAVFLASDDASFVHGHMLVADGGMLCT